MDEKKFNCWECEYRGSVAGSAHICCKHPSLGETSPEEKLMSIFASVGRAPPIMKSSKDLGIKGNAHGISQGWFNFPYNFDPTWLENCEGYKNIDNKEKSDV